MSKLSKHNRYQKSKPAPTTLPALGALVAKALPAIKGVIAKGGKGGGVKDIISNFSNKQKNNQETTEQKDFYADQGEADFSHLSSAQPPFAMRSPFKKKPDSNDAVTVSSSVKGVQVNNTGKYDAVGGTPQSFVAGSSGDPLNGKSNTEAGAVSATGEVNGLEITTTETETSSAQIEKDSQVNAKTGNVVPNPKKDQSNPNNSKAAIEESKSSKKPVIGNETRYGDMHNKHYWKMNKKGKWVKKNDGLWVKDRPKEKEGEIRHTNPFNDKPKTEKPDVKGGVKANLNKKSDTPTSTTTASGYLKYDNARYQEGFNKDKKWFPGLNNAVADREDARKKGDKTAEAHMQSVIDKLRSESQLNKTQNNAKDKKSEYQGEFDKDRNQVSSRKGDPGNKTNVHKVSGNTNMVTTKPGADMSGADKTETIKNSNGTFEVTKDKNNIVTNFKTLSQGAKTKSDSGIVSGSGVSSTKENKSNAKPSKSKNSKTKLNFSSKNTPEQNFDKAFLQQGDITTQQLNKMMNGENIKITGKSGTSYVQAGTQTETKSSSPNPKKSTKRKVEKPIKKENKKKVKNSKPSKNSKLKFKKSGGKKGSGIIKSGKNPLFKS